MKRTLPIHQPYEPPYSVYRVCMEDGRVLYIGSSLNVYTRLRNHRWKEWFYLAHHVDVEEFATEAEARAVERAAIKAEQPPANIKWTRREVPSNPVGQRVLPFVPPPPLDEAV